MSSDTQEGGGTMVPVKSGVWNQYSGMGYRLSSDMQVEGVNHGNS